VSQADVAKAIRVVHSPRSSQTASLRTVHRRGSGFPAAPGRLQNKFRKGMRMKKVRDSARAKGFKNCACVYIAGVLVALIQSQIDICHAQQSVIGNNLYGQYMNERYGYSICYPENLFAPQGESVSGDGQVFLAQDGAKMRVYADYNISNKSIQDAFKEAISDQKSKGVVTFKSQQSNWYIVSGKGNGNIFYQKTILEGEEFISFRAVYPESASAIYGGIVTAMNQCLKPSGPH